MKITVEWVGAGIQSRTVEINGSSIRRAGFTSVKLWDA